MTANEPMTPQERALRDRLHAQLIPPSTPDRLHLAVDAIAEDAMRPARRGERRPLRAPSFERPLPRLRAAFAMAAVVVLVAAALAAGLGFQGQPSVAATPLPPLPSRAPDPVTVDAGAWVSPDVAWVKDTSNRVYLTSDGGMSWSPPRLLPQIYLRGLAFRDASNGWAIFAPQQVAEAPVDVYLTHDGGRSWSKTTLGTIPSAPEGHRLDFTLHFSDAQHGVALAGDYLEPGGADTDFIPVTCLGWTTDDGGSTWRPIPDAPCWRRDWWASADVGLLLDVEIGSPATWLTRDGGQTWTKGTLPSEAPSTAVLLFTLASDGTPQLVTSPGWTSMDVRTTRPGTVLESHDDGRSWAAVREVAPPGDGAGAGSAGSVVLGPDDWLITWMRDPASARTVYETRDGGRTWREVVTLPGAVLSAHWLDRLHGMADALDNSGCSLPEASPCNVGSFLLTNDGGATWHGLPIEDLVFAPRPTDAPSMPAPSPTSVPSMSVQVRYSERDLLALQDRLTADFGAGQPAWLRAIPAKVMGFGEDVEHNCVSIDVSSANPAAAALVLAHYGVPAGMLCVSSDGTGVELMPRGWVDVSVKVASGVSAPQNGWSIEMAPDGTGRWGGGDIGFGVLPGMTSAVPATKGGWTVEVLDEGFAVVGSGHVTIVAAKHVPLVITVK